MKRRKVISLIGLAIVTSAISNACGQQQTTIAPTATNGTTGATLVVYSGRAEDLIGPLFQRFQAETGIQVNVRYGDTAELAATILEEGQNSPADIYFAQDAGALGALQREGRTHPIPENLLNQVDPRFRSREGQWIGITGRARVFNYNTDLVSSDQVPNSIWEITQPEWSGRIGWAPTNGSFQSFVTALRKHEGEQRAREWLEAMQANNPQVYRNNTTIVEALGRGEIALGLVNNYYLFRFKAEDPNFPVSYHYPTGDVGSMINIAGVAIIDSTDQPEAAYAFIEFLLTPEAQQHFAQKNSEYPLIDGIEPPNGQIPIAQINPPDIDLSDLEDLGGTLELLHSTGVL